MGQVRRTTQNLEIIQIRPADNLILIKGSIPGSEGDYVIIREAKKIAKGSKRHQMILESRKVAAPAAAKKEKAAAKAPAKK
jgi:large subunit ribosomal protein L3